MSSCLVLVCAVLSQSAGQAVEPPISRETGEFSRLIEANLPPSALHAAFDPTSKESLSAPAQPRTPSDFFTMAMQGKAENLMYPRNVATAQKELLEHVWDTKVIDGGTFLKESSVQWAAAGTSSAEGWSGQYRKAYPAGDLDGDGLADVFELEIAYSSSTSEIAQFDVKARSGITGALKWTRSLLNSYDFFLLPASDLDRDGGADPMLIQMFVDSQSFSNGCTFVVCKADGAYTFRWELSPLAGATGSAMWSKTYNGKARFSAKGVHAPVGSLGSQDFEATNFGLIPAIQKKANSGNVVINLFDYKSASAGQYANVAVASRQVIESVVLVGTRSDVLTGSRGASIFSRKQEHQLGGATLLPSGSAVGGPSEDLVWQQAKVIGPVSACHFLNPWHCATPAQTDVSFEMIDGDTFAVAWAGSIPTSVQAAAEVLPARSDLNGDGRDDLLFFSSGTAGLRQGAISGADGATLWTLDGEVDLRVIGPVGGDPGSDLVGIEFIRTGGAHVIHLARYDGMSGAELFRTSSISDHVDNLVDVWVYPFGDADGDEALDLAVLSYVRATGTLIQDLESGRTGGAIHRSSGRSSLVLPGGDQDANGTTDGVIVNISSARSEVVLSGVSMPSGQATWSHTYGFLRYFYFSVRPSGDMSGLGGDDLVHSHLQYARTTESRLLVMEGLDGATRWTVGDVFTAPPAK